MNVGYFLTKSLSRLVLLSLPVALFIWAWRFRVRGGYIYDPRSEGFRATYASHRVWFLPSTSHTAGLIGEVLLLVMAFFLAGSALVLAIVWVWETAFDLEYCGHKQCYRSYRYGCPEHQPELREANQKKLVRR